MWSGCVRFAAIVFVVVLTRPAGVDAKQCYKCSYSPGENNEHFGPKECADPFDPKLNEDKLVVCNNDCYKNHIDTEGTYLVRRGCSASVCEEGPVHLFDSFYMQHECCLSHRCNIAGDVRRASRSLVAAATALVILHVTTGDRHT